MKVLYFLIWNTPIAAFSVFWKHYDARLSLSRLSSVSGSTGKRDDGKDADFWKNEYLTWKDKYFTMQKKRSAIKPEQRTDWRECTNRAYAMMITALGEMEKAEAAAKEKEKKAEAAAKEEEKKAEAAAAEEKKKAEAAAKEEEKKAEAEEKTMYFYKAELDEYSIATVCRSSFKNLLYEDGDGIRINNIYKIGRRDDDGKFQRRERKEWILEFEFIEDGLVYEIQSL